MQIKQLLLKTAQGEPMRTVKTLELNQDGIVWGKPSHWTRHVLFLPEEILEEFNIQPGDLRENVIVKGGDIMGMPSGSVLHIGKTKIRITYLCEPCRKVAHLGVVAKFVFKRGILGSVIEGGTIREGDEIIDLGRQYEEIPYHVGPRIIRYLDRNPRPILAKDLVLELGLRTSYCRALPNVMRKMDQKYKNLVRFGQVL